MYIDELASKTKNSFLFYVSFHAECYHKMWPRIGMDPPSSNNPANDIPHRNGQQFWILLIPDAVELTTRISHDTKEKINEFSYLMMKKYCKIYVRKKQPDGQYF